MVQDGSTKATTQVNRYLTKTQGVYGCGAIAAIATQDFRSASKTSAADPDMGAVV